MWLHLHLFHLCLQGAAIVLTPLLIQQWLIVVIPLEVYKLILQAAQAELTPTVGQTEQQEVALQLML